MISITPQGSVYLCKTPLENDYNHQLTFTNQTEQLNYFVSRVQRTENEVTYLKKDNQMIVNFPIDDIIECNYLFYRNNGFTTKYYFCFITNMEYVNENATRISIETDVWQTYQFAIEEKACFVEREHVNDDTIGVNTTREGVDVGEFIVNDVENLDELSTGAHVVIGTTKLPLDTTPSLNTSTNIKSREYNGVYSGLYYLVFKEFIDASKFLAVMDSEGMGENIYSVFLIPLSLYNTNTWDSFTITLPITDTPLLTVNYNFLPSTSDETVMLSDQTISINSQLNGYTPKNNKLFTGEFNKMYVTNNSGDHAEYFYEDFINNSPLFRIIGAICPGCSIKLIPENYKKYDTSNNAYKNLLSDYGLVGYKYPTCSWNTDSYTNWLTQNSVNKAFSTMSDVLSVGALGAVNPALVPVGLFNMVKENMDEKIARQTTPVQAKGNVNVGDVTFASSMSCFSIFKISLRYEYAKRIDDYLSAFGYKINDIKLPNLTGRTNWNYVKTVGCNFEGDIPQVYLQKIREIFNNGITLWHTTTHFLDYSQTNSIVTP